MTCTALFNESIVRQLNDLPEANRAAVSEALVSEFVDESPCRRVLTPFERLVFVMLADMIRRGTLRYVAV